ncbi:GNAT family N-acetyltransferase [Amycolatopsis pithecellobii]|uniref:GNAT family N-acetyltransferase n=1 Tax=Amycolatopsis pithecellobii TaxID=664692 RepID=UPI00140B0047|nr:GNAT family N-acetyltransferase [Amycolatopsis pithecellobii]
MLQPAYPVRTPRLNLRPFVASDTAAFNAIYTHPELVRHLACGRLDRAGVQALLACKAQRTGLTEPGQTLSLAMVLVDTGEVVGDASLGWVRAEHDVGELVIVLHPRHQGKGYAAEAGIAILRLGFEGLDLHQVFGVCATRDIASASLMEGLGMQPDPALREREQLERKWPDELVYSLLALDWRSRAKM